MQAVILACEASDGLESITGFVPHPLLLIERHPLLDRLIKKLETAGISEILIAASADGPEIRSFVYRQGYKAAIATFDVPSDSGSAGAIKLLERLIHSTFLAVSINVVFDFDLRRVIGSHYLNSAVATVAVPSQAADDADDGMIPDSVIDSGVYMLEPELLRAIPARRSYNIMEELLPRLLNAGAPVNFACPSGYWA